MNSTPTYPSTGSTASPVRAVCHLSGDAQHSVPRDSGIDWNAVEDYLLTGERGTGLPTRMGITRLWGTFPDAVHLHSLPGLVICTRLREVLDTAAPGDLDHHPVMVADRQFWLARVPTVIDALNLEASGITLDRHKQVELDDDNRVRIYRSGALTRQAIFRLPQERNHILTTDAVAAAALLSGCTGFSIAGPLGLIR